MIKRSQQFRGGDKVRSVFRAQWHGIIIGVVWMSSIDRKSTHPAYRVLPLLTNDGRPQRKPRTHYLSEHWLRTSEAPMTLPYNIDDILSNDSRDA